MIRVDRGPRPAWIEPVRKAEVKRLAAIVKTRSPRAADFDKKFNKARSDLWKAQGTKCCYCERRVDCPYNDVEHFRPKTVARRGRGRESHGYWWLAWTWENLLFACARCNRSYKRNSFPLARESRLLPRRQNPPGPEVALLLDPSREDPLDYIQFRSFRVGKRWVWKAFPRGDDRRTRMKGRRTINILKLNRPTLLTDYQCHAIDVVKPHIDAVHRAIDKNDQRAVTAVWELAMERLITNRRQQFKALSYDVLNQQIGEEVRRQFGLTLKRPGRARKGG